MRQFSASGLLLVAAVCACFGAAGADNPFRLQSLGSPTFSDIANYTSYDFAASPVGFFEEESVMVSANASVRYLKWRESEHSDSLVQRSTAWDIPDLLAGKPGVFYLRGRYTPVIINDETAGAARTLPLHRFGLILAGQAPGGVFQLAAQADGFYGEETAEGSDNTRLIAGLRVLEGSIGTQLHPLVRLGMRGGASAKLDTLRDKAYSILEDRYFEGQIPRLGWFVDFGKPGFPVQSDFCIEIATNRFVYVTKPPRFPEGNEDPWRGDSLAWKWQVLGEYARAGFTYRPALYLGYWRDHYQSYAPTESNDDLNVGAKRDGEDWKFSSFRFGIGGAVKTKAYSTFWWEYARTTLSLEYGDAWPTLQDKDRGYDRIAFGIEGNVHAIQALRIPQSIEVFMRLGYFNRRENSGFYAYGMEDFSLMTPITNRTQVGRDQPDFNWGADVRTYGVTLGIGANFLNKALLADLYWGFLTALTNQERKAFEFGARVGYNVKGPQ